MSQHSNSSAQTFSECFKSHSERFSVAQRFAPALSLAWTFLYLLFFRLATWFGLPSPTPFANAVQLILTLKVEKRDQWKNVTAAPCGEFTDLLFVGRW